MYHNHSRIFPKKPIGQEFSFPRHVWGHEVSPRVAIDATRSIKYRIERRTGRASTWQKPRRTVPVKFFAAEPQSLVAIIGNWFDLCRVVWLERKGHRMRMRNIQKEAAKKTIKGRRLRRDSRKETETLKCEGLSKSVAATATKALCAPSVCVQAIVLTRQGPNNLDPVPDEAATRNAV